MVILAMRAAGVVVKVRVRVCVRVDGRGRRRRWRAIAALKEGMGGWRLRVGFGGVGWF